MEKPSISTIDRRSDATSQYSQGDTTDPTENSGNDSVRREDRNEQLAELVKDILETAWKESSTEVQTCLEETLQEQGPDAVSGADWQWQYSAPLNEHSRLSRDLSDPPVAVGRIGTPYYRQIEEVWAMLPPRKDERRALLGGHRMMLAGCHIRLNKCTVGRYTTNSVHISVWFERSSQMNVAEG